MEELVENEVQYGGGGLDLGYYSINPFTMRFTTFMYSSVCGKKNKDKARYLT
jgi:hypothetical protein